MSVLNSFAESYIVKTVTKVVAAAYKVAQIRTDKYAELTSTHIFYPFAIKTAGTWHDVAIELTQEIGGITSITEDSVETANLFQHLSMAVQRGSDVSFINTMIPE